MRFSQVVILQCCEIVASAYEHDCAATVALKHAEAFALFRDIECGALDAKDFQGDVEVENLAARLHKLWVPCFNWPHGSCR